MSRRYYYLVASLPMLEFDAEPPFSYQDFLSTCQRLMAEEDYALLKRATLGPEAKPCDVASSTLMKWNHFCHGLRNELARYRAQHNNKDPLEYMRPEIYSLPKVAEMIGHAAHSDNLLVAEKMIDKYKWEFLEELTLGHFFDVDFLIVYALKLQMLERHKEIRSSRGKEAFETFKNRSYVESEA